MVFQGKRYGLARLGFGLNDVPQIMKTIISAVLSQEEMVKKVTSAYLDDIYINKDVSPKSHIQVKFAQFGLDCKDPEQLEYIASVLGVDVKWEEDNRQCKWVSLVPGIPEVLTRWRLWRTSCFEWACGWKATLCIMCNQEEVYQPSR